MIYTEKLHMLGKCNFELLVGNRIHTLYVSLATYPKFFNNKKKPLKILLACQVNKKRTRDIKSA